MSLSTQTLSRPGPPFGYALALLIGRLFASVQDPVRTLDVSPGPEHEREADRLLDKIRALSVRTEPPSSEPVTVT